jgi:two-component system sensor histidine kinase KdpD
VTPDVEAGLRDNMELAVDLGAEVVYLEGDDVAATLARFAKERHITQIVVGKTNRSPFKQLLRPAMSQRLLNIVTQDVHIVIPVARGRSSTAGGTRETIGGAREPVLSERTNEAEESEGRR